jgi:hypothetical protein
MTTNTDSNFFKFVFRTNSCKKQNEQNQIVVYTDEDDIILEENINKNVLNIDYDQNLSKCPKYCNKCYQKKKSAQEISKIEIFNKINNIVFNSISMPDVYNKVTNIITPFNKWLELNEDGYSVFHWFAWFISVKIKKYQHIKPKVYAFFQKVFSDNTIESIFTKKEIETIINLTSKKNPTHTILYHLVRYCENPNDTYYKRLYKLLIDNGAVPLDDKQIQEIKNTNIEEENLPDDLKIHISDITHKYKYIEDLIISSIEKNCPDYQLSKCAECGALIDFTKELPKIISYAKNNENLLIKNLVQFAYYQRKLLNRVFDNYYKLKNSNSDLNKIHKRHTHVLDIYSENLVV